MPLADRAQERRERLLTAALRLFANRSYDEVTVADVCADARIAKRHFYEHFADREAILLELHRRHHDWFMTGMADAVPDHPGSVPAVLQAIATWLVTAVGEHPDRGRVIYISAPRMERRRRGLMHKDAALIGSLVLRAAEPPTDEEQFARLMLGLTAGITEMIMDWLAGDLGTSQARMIEAVSTFGAGVTSLAGLRPHDQVS